MDADRRNDTGIFRYTDVEYTPEGHTDAYRWDDFLGIAGGHVYSAMDTIDMVSTGGQYEGDEPEHAYACEIVGCCGLSDGVALFRPVSHDGADLIQIAFLRNDVDDATGAYTERFEAGSFDLPAADLPRSEFGVDLLEYFSGRSFKYTPGVSRGLDPREAVDSIEDAIGCDLGLFDGFWLGVPGEADMRVGPYTKKSLLDFSYYAKELSCRYGFADSDILEIARHLPDECPDCLAAVKAYLDCEYVSDGNAPDEKTYRWGDFLEIAGGDARYAAMLVDRTAAGEPEAGLHPETLVDQDIRDGEAFMLAGRPIAPEDAYDLPGTVHGLYKELADNVDRFGMLFRDWRGFAAGTDADDVLRAIDGAFGETEYSRAGTVLGAYADDTFMSPLYVAQDAPRDVTPLTPWEDEDGVAFLSRTLDADSSVPVPCLWYCMRDGEQGFEVGGVKLDCSKIGFDEVSAAAASNGIDCVLAYLEESPRGLEPLCDIAVRRVDAGMSDVVRHFGNRDEAMAMLGAITGCRVQAYGVDTLTYRASLGNAAAAKLAAGALAPASIEGVEVLEKSEGRDLDRLVNVDLEHGAYKLSRDVAPLQRLFSKHVLRNFDARLAELDDGSAARRTKSMAGRVFKDEFGMMWLIVGDDLGEFVDALDQDGKERHVTVLALRKLVATQGDGRWLTKSLDETESAFKGRYQPKAWRGALPSLRLRDLSAGE